jgi:hypothetical protein
MDDLEVPPILGNTNIYDISYISMICGWKAHRRDPRATCWCFSSIYIYLHMYDTRVWLEGITRMIIVVKWYQILIFPSQKSQVVAATLTEKSHEALRQEGLDPILASDLSLGRHFNTFHRYAMVTGIYVWYIYMVCMYIYIYGICIYIYMVLHVDVMLCENHSFSVVLCSDLKWICWCDMDTYGNCWLFVFECGILMGLCLGSNGICLVCLNVFDVYV